MFDKYINFVRSVSVNRLGALGVILVTSSFVTFVILEGARLIGFLNNAYVGLLTYLLFPLLFVIGLILIPIAWRQRKRDSGKTGAALLAERFGDPNTRGGFLGSRVFLMIGIFTLANVIILGAASSRMLSYMDEPEFCGTACHSVMNPEWVTYQQSPHARVKCVQCHVGEGVDALLDSKLNGMWQMISVTFDLLERPIPTPVHNLRPARETCEKCHWPEKFYGSRLVTNVRYESDSVSSRKFVTLNLKVDAGFGDDKSGIHWHVAEENEVRYASLDDKAEEMIWVDVRQDDSSFRRFTNRSLGGVASQEEHTRTLDCIDCHNRATHVYERPADAVDRLMRAGELDRSLPFIKREALAAITGNYADNDAADDGIANHITSFYRQNYPDLARRRLVGVDSAIAVLREVYARNIHHEMNITWDTYPSHIGHVGDGGCFRCHNDNMVDDAGRSISSDCTLCHSILAFNDEEPFMYLRATDTTSAEAAMHEYLRDEFLEFISE